jgi:hypothetical protein
MAEGEGMSLQSKFSAMFLKGLVEANDIDETFIRDGDKTLMQFDQLAFKPRLDGADIEFYWRGKLSYTMRLDTPIGVGQNLTLSGITGRMEITLAL